MTGYQARVPSLITAYFGAEALTEQGHPTIGQTFVAGRGWRSYPGTKRVSLTWLRKLRREGVTAVSIRLGTRLADFDIAEIERYHRRQASLPALGDRKPSESLTGFFAPVML
jgi:hypothetical protein